MTVFKMLCDYLNAPRVVNDYHNSIAPIKSPVLVLTELEHRLMTGVVIVKDSKYYLNGEDVSNYVTAIYPKPPRINPKIYEDIVSAKKELVKVPGKYYIFSQSAHFCVDTFIQESC